MAALLAVALLVQEAPVASKEADALRARARVETDGGGRLKVSLDGAILYEGPGARAGVDAVENRRLARKFVTVAVDGEERVRVPAGSLGKPARLALPRLDGEIFLRLVTEESTLAVVLVARDGAATYATEIYRGPVSAGKPELTGRGEFVEVRLGEELLFRMPRPARKAAGPAATVADVVARMNRHRRAAGLAPVEARADLTRACDLHALYLAKNAGSEEVRGLAAHREEPALPGYTEEGAAAGRLSVIHSASVKLSQVESVDSLAATLYHRVRLLDPRLDATGVGWAWDAEGGGVVVIHCGATAGPPRDEPVVYPGPDQQDVPHRFALGGHETPDPVPEAAAQAGYPVTVQFAWEPRDVVVRLLTDGREVESWLSTPERPARADFPQGRIACLIPKRPLEAGRTYTVEARARRASGEWSKTWSFTTAAR